MFKRFIDVFIKKNGEVSKTAIFLSIATILLLILWPFQSLFAGTEFGWWTIPDFNAAAAATVLGSLAALYTVNHGWVNKPGGPSAEDFAEIREQIDSVARSVKGND